MPMRRTPFGAVCSQIEHPKMSLTGSRGLRLGPNFQRSGRESTRVPPHHARPVPFPIAPVASLLFRQSRCIVSILLTKDPRPVLSPILARFHSLAGGLPASVSDEPYLIIPVFHLDKGSHFVPGYRDISLFPTARHASTSDNDVVDVRLFLNETKIRRWEKARKETIKYGGQSSLTDTPSASPLSTERPASASVP